jgi:hypothetical protein
MNLPLDFQPMNLPRRLRLHRPPETRECLRTTPILRFYAFHFLLISVASPRMTKPRHGPLRACKRNVNPLLRNFDFRPGYLRSEVRPENKKPTGQITSGGGSAKSAAGIQPLDLSDEPRCARRYLDGAATTAGCKRPGVSLAHKFHRECKLPGNRLSVNPLAGRGAGSGSAWGFRGGASFTPNFSRCNTAVTIGGEDRALGDTPLT